MLLRAKIKPKDKTSILVLNKINETPTHIQFWFGEAHCEFKKSNSSVIGKLGYLAGIPEGEQVKLGMLLGKKFKVKIVNNQVKFINKP
jgi:nucleoside permease NupC